MSRFILRQIARNQSTKDIVVDRTATIQAEPGAAYQLLDARSMKPVSGVVLKRRGDALVVEADGEIAVEVERFYGSQAGAVFEASGGGGQVQVVTEATVVPELGQAATPAGGGASAASGAGAEPLLAALTIGGLGLLSSSGGSAAAPVENTVVAKVVAGPVVKGNDLIAMIYAADDKTLLGQGAINEDGTVTVKVGSYTGVVVVKVRNDQNPANDHVDYMDEATGVSKDLGDVVLSSMGEIVTLNGVITLNVNILTALAYHEAAEAAKGAPLTAPLVRDTNAAVAKAFGLESLTEGDIKTIVDQGGNASSSNKYGELLAALSGADKNNGGSVKATLDALINAVSVTGTTATLTPAVTTLLSEGAKVVDPANSKGLLSTVQSALQSSSNTTPSTPPSTPVATDTTPPVVSSPTTTISRTGNATVQSNEPGTAYLVRDTVAVTNLASITSAADNMWNSVALSEANTATPLPATGLVDGTYKLYAVDAAGNLSSASSNSIALNATPPVTTDTTPPVASTTTSGTISSTGNVTVQSNEPGTAYLVRDTVAVTNLASITSAADNVWNSVALSAANTATPLPATGLGDGTYKVYAVDAAGNLSSASSNSITIYAPVATDTTPPVVSVTTATIASTGSAVVQSNETGTAYLVRNTVSVTDLASITSAADNVWNSVALSAANTATSVAATGLGDGTYKVYAVDALGNLSSASSNSITVDTTPPVASVTTAAIKSTQSAEGQSSERGTGYLVRDTVAVTDLASITSAADNVWNSWPLFGGVKSGLSATGLGEGTYKFYAVDTAGNLSSASSNSITIDNTPPVASVTTANITTAGSAEVQSSEPGTAYLVRDGVQPSLYFIMTAADQFVNSVPLPLGNTVTSLPATGLEVGTYKVFAADAAGNLSTASSNSITIFIPDTTPPTVQSVSSTTMTSTGSTRVFSSEPGTAYLVRDTVAVTNLASITSAADNVWNSGNVSESGGNIIATGLSFGTYKVYAADASGNLSTAWSGSILINSPIDLSAIAAGSGGFVINGRSAGDYSGRSVASGGDVNGDGLTDLIVGAYFADPTGRSDGGKSYVVFGKTGGGEVELSGVETGSGGFVINGAASVERSGQAVAFAGDLNGDGLSDLIIGAPGAGDSSTGKSYVVFGKAGGAAVELSAVGAGNGGFGIQGQFPIDNSGSSVASAGDVNGDGLADLIVGALRADPTGRSDAGKSYVVFGKTGGEAVALSAIEAGGGGFVISGQSASDGSGVMVASAGDVNGDGLADLIVGASKADPTGRSDAGKSYVVFGKTGGAAVELSAVEAGGGGFVISGQSASDESGVSVASAGDVNGDGLADLIVGASNADPTGRSNAGKSYVVFGKTGVAAVELSAVAAGGGFVINGAEALFSSGLSVASAGDMNGDGLADLIVGAFRGMGMAYVVFGKASDAAIELSAVADNRGGFVINGGDLGDSLFGSIVASAGDVNGDGLADLIVGAPEADPTGKVNAGKSYVIFGSTSGAFSETAVDEPGTTGNDALSDGGAAKTLVGGAGDDSLSATAASALYGGSGKDSFQINAAMITALRSPLGSGGNVDQLARIDGGTGVDAIVLSGASLELDLTQIANQSASNTNGSSRINSIEAIDLTGTGNNTLKLKVNDLFDMTGFNNFAATGRRQLLVKGDTGDAVDLADGSGTTGWTQAGTQQTIDSVAYNVWNHNTSLVTLYVAPSISVI